jgi:urease accessory protein
VVRAERVAGRTRLTEVRQQPPLQISRARYPDPTLPDLASITIVSPSGGVLQGDVLETTIHVGTGARLHVGTQSSTRIYRAPDLPARMVTTLDIGPSAYLECLPDPAIPYAGSRFEARTTCHVARDATMILSDAMTAGRIARGEVFGMERFESRVEIRWTGGDLIASDAIVLGNDEPIARLGRLGRHRAVGTLYVIHPGFGAEILRDAVAIVDGPMSEIGASDLPDGAGAWLRVLAAEGRGVSAVLRAGWAAARRHILGVEPGPDRRP